MCSPIIKALGFSTKSLITHLKSKHQIHTELSLEKSVTEPLFKKQKIDSYFKKDCHESLGEVAAKLVAVDGLAFNQTASSKLLEKSICIRWLQFTKQSELCKKRCS